MGRTMRQCWVKSSKVCGCCSKRSKYRRCLPKKIPTEMLRKVQNETRLEEPQIHSLYDRFRQLAPYGELTLSGFRRTMGCLGSLDNSFLSYRLFTAFATSWNGVLTFDDFAMALGTMMAGTDDEKLALAFKILCAPSNNQSSATHSCASNDEPRSLTVFCNVDKNTGINYEEFEKVIFSIQASRKELVGWFPDYINTRMIKQVFDQVASVRDNREPLIYFEEFRRAITTNEGFLSLFLMTLGPEDRNAHSSYVLEEVPDIDKMSRRSGAGIPRSRTLHCSPWVSRRSSFLSCRLNMGPLSKDNNIHQLRSNSSGYTFMPSDIEHQNIKHHMSLPRVTTRAWTLPVTLPTSPLTLFRDATLCNIALYKSITLPVHVDYKWLSNVERNITSSVLPSQSHDEDNNWYGRSRFSSRVQRFNDTFKKIIECPYSKSSVFSRTSQLPCAQESEGIENSVAETYRHNSTAQFLGRQPSAYASGESNSKKSVPQPDGTWPDRNAVNPSSTQHDKNSHPQQNALTLRRDASHTQKSNQVFNFPSLEDSFYSVSSSGSQKITRGTQEALTTWPLNHCLSSLICACDTGPYRNVRHHMVPYKPRTLSANTLRDTNALHTENMEESNPATVTAHPLVPIKTKECKATHHAITSRGPVEFKFLSPYRRASSERLICNPNSLTHHSLLFSSTFVNLNKPSLDASFALKDDFSSSLEKTKSGYLPSSGMFMNRPNFRRDRKRQGSIAQIQQRIQRCRPEYKLLSPTKGVAVYFGHPSWNMVLDMMIGIRLAGKLALNKPRRALESCDFDTKAKINLPSSPEPDVPTKMSRFSCHVTTVHFIDYAPMIFRKIRDFFGLNSEEYFQSLGPEQIIGNMVLGNLASLSELCTEGQSGAFFYYSADGKYLIKTITRAASKFLKKILQDYYNHIMSNTNTLITRFYGFHAIYRKKKSGALSPKLYFIIMNNVFHTPVALSRRYDLKGSWEGRATDEISKQDPSIALKDNDMLNMDEKISIGPEYRDALLNVIETDVRFFTQHRILDYSLVVGIHELRKKKFHSDTNLMDTIPTSLRFLNVLSDNIPHSFIPFHQRYLGGLISSDGTMLYYLGIVDILTRWTVLKKLERRYKMVVTGSSGAAISCAPPSFYAGRFVSFMRKQVE